MTPVEWITSGVSGFTLLMSAGGMIFSHGRTSQRVEAIEVRQKEHDREIDAIKASGTSTKGAVDLLAGKLDGLSDKWDAERKLAAVELGRVADAIKSGHDLIGSKLEGMERFNRSELEQMKHDVRDVKQAVSILERAPETRARSHTSA